MTKRGDVVNGGTGHRPPALAIQAGPRLPMANTQSQLYALSVDTRVILLKDTPRGKKSKTGKREPLSTRDPVNEGNQKWVKLNVSS